MYSPSPPSHGYLHRPRPWSPDPYDPLPRMNTRTDLLTNTDSLTRQQLPQRREASEASIEALDLADYAHTLQTRTRHFDDYDYGYDPYPQFQPPHQPRGGGRGETQIPISPLSPIPSYPPGSYIPNGALGLSSQDSYSLTSHPNLSLVSRGPTLSSSGTGRHSSSTTTTQNRTRTNYPNRQFSLPIPNLPSSPSSNTSHHHLSNHHHQQQQEGLESEIDISQFPAFSRSWYQSNPNPNLDQRVHSPTQSIPIDDDDMYTPIPSSTLGVGNKKKKNVFDPDYVNYTHPHPTRAEFETDPNYSKTSLTLGIDSTNTTRGLLPWSNSDTLINHGSSSVTTELDPSTKEERIRMLEYEFGNKSNHRKGKGKGDEDGDWDFLDEDGNPIIGTVDKNGNLVTQGPKKRIMVRLFLVFGSIGAGVPSIWAAVVIKPNPPPPPAGKPPAIILYITSILSFILLCYLFVLRPCCFNPRKRKRKAKNGMGMGMGMDNPLVGGMMVLPVPNPGAKSHKKNKNKNKRKNGKGGGGGDGDVQVNLIVDPHLFSGGDHDEESEESDDENRLGGFHNGSGNGNGNGKKRRGGRGRGRKGKRRSIFIGLAMEEEWKKARSWNKKIALVDGVGIIVWGTVFILVLIGKRCPSGAFEGWCNAYNVSTACACLLSVAFGVGLFFDVKDLYASKESPRTRT